jgi:hypothetical protein
MTWKEIIALLTSPLIAAAVVIIGLIWRDRIERRNAAQSWYEQYYITDGVDRLIAHFLSLKSVLESYEQPELPKRTDREPVPFDADSRVRVLLQDWTFHFAIGLVHDTVRHLEYVRVTNSERLKEDFPRETLKEMIALTKQITDVTLPLLRERLLSVEVHRKMDIYAISENLKIKSMLGVVKEGLHKRLSESPNSQKKLAYKQ